MRENSAMITRMYSTRSGTWIFRSRSTAIDVPELVAHRGDIVQAVGVRDHLLVVRHLLAVLLEAAVQIADVRDHVDDDLAVHHQLEPEHAVRRRVLGPHADDHLLRPERTSEAGDRDRAASPVSAVSHGGVHQYGTFIPL